MKRIFSFAVVLVLAACGEGQLQVDQLGLPNWATEEEQALQELAPPPVQIGVRALPPAGFRLPAEFEPTRAVVITYTTYTTLLDAIARGVSAAGSEVWAIGGPTSISGVPAAQYKRLSIAYNTVWSRDYGPVGIDEATGALGIVDNIYRHYASRQNDDAIPCRVASYAGSACYSSNLILDGGNLLTDGRGTLFMTRRTYTWNSSMTEAAVDQRLRDALGVTNIVKFDYAKNGSTPADGTGHIDMFVKLLGPCTALVAQSSQAPFTAPLDAAANTFAGLECAPGQRYQVVRIPGWSSGGTWYTYTNSLIVNNTVLVPSYSSGDNEGARQIYQRAMPGANVVLIPSDASITSGGSIHCVTKELPLNEPVANRPPVASAGADQSAAGGALVTLDGSSSSDPDGDSITFAWTQTAGPDVVLSDPASARPTFTAPAVTAATRLTFSLVVSDAESSSPADTVDIVVGGENTIEAASTDTPMSIPDYNITGVTSTIAIAEAGTIAGMQVDVHITHTYIGDLKVVLRCPSGTQAILHNRTGSSADNIVQTYTVTSCNGQTTTGSFRLTASDNARQDVGTLDSWKLRITRQ